MSDTIRPAASTDFAQWKLRDHDDAFYGHDGETALAPGIAHTTWSRFFGAHE